MKEARIEWPEIGDGIWFEDWKPETCEARCAGCDRLIAVISRPAVITLEPGYVNARGRHANGLPWYKRGRQPLRPSDPVRGAVVVTCGCGVENRVSEPFTRLAHFVSEVLP